MKPRHMIEIALAVVFFTAAGMIAFNPMARHGAMAASDRAKPTPMPRPAKPGNSPAQVIPSELLAPKTKGVFRDCPPYCLVNEHKEVRPPSGPRTSPATSPATTGVRFVSQRIQK